MKLDPTKPTPKIDLVILFFVLVLVPAYLIWEGLR